MNTFNILQHLINLKVYRDFITSGLATFPLFIKYIEEGNDPTLFDNFTDQWRHSNKNGTVKALHPDLDDYEPTDQELQKYKDQPERDHLEDYLNVVDRKIGRVLDYNPQIQNVFNLDSLHRMVNFENSPLNEFIKVKKEHISSYVNLIMNRDPEEFWDILLTKYPKEFLPVEVPLNPEKINNVIFENILQPNCHLNIFKSCKEFIFFEQLAENIIRKNKELADYSFIFGKMKNDGFLQENVRNNDFILWLSKNKNVHLDKIKTLGVCSTPDKEKHYNIAKELYLKP